ncbi:MAG: helix-turn-helix transcriptional regulator [Acidobacteria bacterium]|jgi:transcriptional regulator with XRE-family HTH domain|nr:helix-turn-helix transcriptional regulator [Acidobacteriota bacterium]
MALLIEIDSFGKWLKVKREAQGLSMRVLAEKADNVCSPSYIAQLETNYYVGKRGDPMQPSEEIVEKLAIALGESVNEARQAASYPSIDETAEENIRFELLSVLHKYNRLSVKARKFANRQLRETIDFLLAIEGVEVEDIPIEDVEEKGFEDLTKPSEKSEMLSDEEISRLGIRPIKVGKIKKKAR